MKRAVVRNSKGRKFVIVVDGKEAFVGTKGLFSNFAAQMLVYEALENCEFKTTGSFRDLELDGDLVIGVGYKVPVMGNPIKKIERSINTYDCK